MLADGGSRVFLQVNGKVEVTESKTDRRLVYRMKGVQAIQTNRFPLVTSFFVTPVAKVQLVGRGHNLDMVIDLREAPFYWLEQYKGTAQKLIWKECGPMPALWPIGAQLAKDIKTESVHSPETIASEILERADGYYRLVWKECSDDQKFVLAQLAEDGLLNPTNGRAIRQLVREGLITTDPQFRLMNESFRRFLRSATSAGLKQQWLRESRSSGWGKMHGVFFTTMILLGAFLLTTQNALWQSSAAYVTTALGALGTLAGYERRIALRFARELETRRYYYGLEKRWPSSKFWRRRAL